MRRLVFFAIVLLTVPAAAQRPWEQRLDLPAVVPLELPSVPATNPFASPLVSPPAPKLTPLKEKLAEVFSVEAVAYVDSTGSCRRVVFTDLPWPGLGGELKEAITETSFTPARAQGAPVPVWLPLGIDLKGRIDEGHVVRLQAVSPEPGVPPVPDAAVVPTPDAHDLALPAIAAETVEQLPSPKRFRARVDGRTWRQGIRLLAEISEEGHPLRVVFLSCPDGLRHWLLSSMTAWLFRPADGKEGPRRAWVQLEGEVEVAMGNLASDAVRVKRQGSYPRLP